MNPLVKWLSSNGYVFGAVLIIVGIFVGLFGKPLFKPTICIVGTLVFVVLSTLFIFSVFFNRSTANWVGWVVFAVCLLLGGIVGLILAKLSRLGVGVLAGWGGFCLGLITYNAFMYKADNGKKIVFWIWCLSIAIVAGVLSIFLFNHALIIATSLVGSYAFVRGISMYAGGFPNEMELVEEL
jgi:uncharacterized membrane protein HdeD (DUF308 family)